MATAIKRISDGKIVIECSEEEFELLYQSVKAKLYMASVDRSLFEITHYTNLRTTFKPLYDIIVNSSN